ncbi:MAG: BlaI/MecI/CopY family transcriptional regulator [Candidatus Latescibacterota bacterium]
MSGLRLGRAQMRIMQVLWDKKRATAQEITDAVNDIEPIKHSTIQTFLRVLVKKKLVAYDVEGRTFVYYPLVESENVTLNAVHNFIDTVFSGSLEGMISYVIKNVDASPEQLEKIRKLLDEEEKH